MIADIKTNLLYLDFFLLKTNLLIFCLISTLQNRNKPTLSVIKITSARSCLNPIFVRFSSTALQIKIIEYIWKKTPGIIRFKKGNAYLSAKTSPAVGCTKETNKTNNEYGWTYTSSIFI